MTKAKQKTSVGKPTSLCFCSQRLCFWFVFCEDFEFYNGRMSSSCIKLWHDDTWNKTPNGSDAEVRKRSICGPLASPPATFQLSSLFFFPLRTKDDRDSTSDKVSSGLPLTIKREGSQVSSCR